MKHLVLGGQRCHSPGQGVVLSITDLSLSQIPPITDLSLSGLQVPLQMGLTSYRHWAESLPGK